MRLLEASSILFNSALGPVEEGDLNRSLELLLKGMLGIFVVMLLIFLVILILSRLSEKRSRREKTEEPEQKAEDAQENGAENNG